MTGCYDGVWRDERRLPLGELRQAMAVYSADGQVDDATGGDAGAEAEFGTEPAGSVEADAVGTDAAGADAAGVDAADEGDPDPDSEQGRQLRPSPDGRIGPV